MNQLKAASKNVVELTEGQAALVSGGVEKEGLYPRKFGDIDYQLYVDGVLMGTVYGPIVPDADVGSGRPIDPIYNGRI